MQFDQGHLYHIYNRGNNSQVLFFERENYLFFLSKIRKYLHPLVDILAYCLMPNHFHLLIYVPEIASSKHSECDSKSRPELINKNIGIILSSYTRAINKKHGRTGSLFQSKTKAKNLSNPDYAFTCFHYIHQNPLSAGLVNLMEEWEFSSYKDYAGLRDGTLCKKVLAVELLDTPIKPILFIEQSKGVKIENEEKECLL